MENYSVFRKYPTLEQAQELIVLLEQNTITSQLADNISPLDATFSGNTVQHQYEVKIHPSDFERANQLVDELAKHEIEQVAEDHYLFGFTNEELYEVLLKSDEWSEFDYALAQKILTQRGKSIDTDLLEGLKKTRLELLAKPETGQKPWIIAGYILAVLSGLIAIPIGYALWQSKKTLPDGTKVNSYQEMDRMHGKNIFFLGCIVFLLVLFFKIVFWY